MDGRSFWNMKELPSQEQIDEHTRIGTKREELKRARQALKGKDSKIYIITTSELWPVKIGVSDDPVGRVFELQTGNWHKLHLFRAYRFHNEVAYEIEKMIHYKLSPNLLCGEWFGIKAEKAGNMVEAILTQCGYGIVNKD